MQDLIQAIHSNNSNREGISDSKKKKKKKKSEKES